jgi:cobalt-zinc-cadmium efflux system protein
MVAGTLILLYGWYWTDALLTLVIAGYVLWQGMSLMPRTIRLLMEGAPEHVAVADVIAAMEAMDGVKNVHHVHVWQLDEHQNALEAHVMSDALHLADIEVIKDALKAMLAERFGIGHSTLEFEDAARTDCPERFE